MLHTPHCRPRGKHDVLMSEFKICQRLINNLTIIDVCKRNTRNNPHLSVHCDVMSSPEWLHVFAPQNNSINNRLHTAAAAAASCRVGTLTQLSIIHRILSWKCAHTLLHFTQGLHGELQLCRSSPEIKPCLNYESVIPAADDEFVVKQRMSHSCWSLCAARSAPCAPEQRAMD